MDELLKRFTSHVDKSGDCWLWQPGKDKDGYGKIKVAGKHLRAHRLSYELYVGPIPESVMVLHRCDVPGCVNPDHLWLGTALDNNRDRDQKGRNRYAKRTHCVHGHLYTPENTLIDNGARKCVTCVRKTARMASRKYREKIRLAG